MRLNVNDVDYRILDHIKKGDFIRSKVLETFATTIEYRIVSDLE